MSKSVLVMATPKYCLECPLCETHKMPERDSYVHLCIYPIDEENGFVERIPDAELTKPDWCPLLPLPERKNLDDIVKEGLPLQYEYAQGYNDCLDDIQKGNNEDKIQEVILEILEKNYESADIRCGFNGDVNSYYINNNIVTSVSIEQYTYSLDDCTYRFLEEKIKEIIDPIQESCTLFQKFLESLPEHIDLPLMSLINRDKDVKRLCIYFSDCGVINGNVTIYIGSTII